MSTVIANGADDKIWLWKWPGPIPVGSSVQCETNEVAVLFEYGGAQGVFEAGAGTIDKQGDFELLFVRTTPTIRFGT